MRIQHNIMAMNAYRNYSSNTSALSKNLEKLSSGYKINRAGDDAAGLAISEKMRAQITGLKTAQKNAKDGISLVQTAEGALTEVHDMLNRALELSQQSANGTYDNDLDRKQMQKELDQLRSEINRIADSTNFNGIKLLDGSLDKKISDAMGNIKGLVDNSDGMIVNAPVDGAGIQETVDITFNPEDLFGAGDSLTFSVADAAGNSTNITLNYDSTVTVGTDEGYTPGASGAADTAKFGGKTMDEQMNSIANALNHANSKLNGTYTATVKRDDNGKAIGVTLKAVDEGTPTLTIDTNSVKANDVQVKADKVDTAGSDGTQVTHAAKNMGWNNLLAGAANGSSPELKEGDTIQLKFNVNGRAMSVTLEAGKDFAIGTTVKGTMENFVNKLNDPGTTFDDNSATGMDESQLKVKDYFDFTANETNGGLSKEGSLKVASKQIGGKDTANIIDDAIVTRKGGNSTTVAETIGQAVTIDKYDLAGATLTPTTPNSATVTLADTTIDLSNSSTTLTAAQVATLNGTTLNMDGIAITFKDEDSYEGKAGEVLVDKTLTGATLLTAIQAGLNKTSDAELRAAQEAGSDCTHKQFDLSTLGQAAGVIGAGTANITQNAYTGMSTTPLEAPTAQGSNLTFTNDFSVGEKVELRGTLSDGRTFEITLEAVAADTVDVGENQFKLGDDLDSTVENIKSALESSANQVTVYTGSTSTKVGADKLFSGAGGEFAVSLPGGTNVLAIAATGTGVPGKGVAARLDGTRTIAKDVIAPTVSQTAGKVPSKALNQITFDANKVEQGTTIDIDGKTYEFVTDAKFVSNPDHTAVVVGNLGKRDDTGALASDAATADDISNALKNTLDNLDGNSDGKFTAENGGEYTVNVDAGTGVLKIETSGMGTGNVALDVAAGTAKRDAAIVKFATTDTGTKTNPSKALNMKVGDTVTINGKTYEFTDGEHRTKEEGNVGVSLKDITTAQEAAHALADAVNNSDGDKVIATVNEKDGSVVLTSKFNADAEAEVDPYAPPKVELPTDSNGLKLQIGDTAESFNQLTVSVQDMHAETLGIGELYINTQDGAAAAVVSLKKAINMVSDVRGTLGATQNRLDHTINNLSVMEENIQDAEASIRDVDVAKEMMDYTKNNILVQSAQAMLAQANQVPQGVLQLLQ